MFLFFGFALIFWLIWGYGANVFELQYRLIITMISLTYILSMYLLMDHNKDKYHKFLKIVYNMRLYWICCCYRNMVIEQLMEMDEDYRNTVEMNMNNQAGNNVERSIDDTSNPSINDQEIYVKGTEMSTDITVTNEP